MVDLSSAFVGAAQHCALDQELARDLEGERRVELVPVRCEHRVERVGLGDRAREAVEQEPVAAVGVASALAR